MQEPQDHDIESRLLAIQPAVPDPALRQRIGASLEDHPTGSRGNAWSLRRRALVSLAAAAAIAVAGYAVWQVAKHAEPTQQIVVSPQPEIVQDKPAPHRVSTPAAATSPTLLAFNTALQQSPEQAYALLDRLGAEQLARLSSDPSPLFATPAVPLMNLYKELP